MRRIRPLEGFFLLVILSGAAGHWALTSDPRQRHVEFLPEMVYGAAYEAQDPNPVFPDGRTQQVPPPGTIARGHAPLRVGDRLLSDGTTPWERLDAAERAAWDALVDPWHGEALDPGREAALVARGSAVFQVQCAVCHGPGGLGDGPVTRRGVPPPPSLKAEAALGMSDGQMFRVITHGRGNMAPYAAQVGREDRWLVIRYIRSLQRLP